MMRQKTTDMTVLKDIGNFRPRRIGHAFFLNINYISNSDTSAHDMSDQVISDSFALVISSPEPKAHR